METVGVKIKQFDIPVCKSFDAKMLNDQLCYEVNLQKISTRENFLKITLTAPPSDGNINNGQAQLFIFVYLWTQPL